MGRREDIIFAAMTVFAAKGINKATMDDIATECGVSKGTLYLYFDSKNALIWALYAHQVQIYLQAVSEAAQQQGTPPEKLAGFLKFVEQAMQGQEALIKLIPELTLYIIQHPSLIEIEKTSAAATQTALQKIIEEGIQQGFFRPVNTHAVTNMILGASMGIFMQSYVSPEQDLKHSLEYLSEFIAKGLAK